MRYKLSEVVDIIGGGTPKRSVDEYWNGDIPWISIKDFSSSRWIENTDEFITELGLKKSSAKLLNKNDLVISARGTVGLVAQITKKMTFNQYCYGLKVKTDILTNEYLYYWLKQNITYVKTNVHGSVFDTITRDTFDALFIDVPDFSQQKFVVDVLTSLDSKIELNNQMIATLEELAATLFKRWFVDFEFPDENGDPYKSSGGKMVESELGEVPEGWEVEVLSSLMSIQSGKRPLNKSDKKSTDNPIPIVGASKIMGYTNTVLSNSSIITTGRVGTHGVIQRFREPVWVSDNSFLIKSDYEGFVYGVLNNIDFKSLNRGSTQPLITQTDLKNIRILVPNKKMLEKFENLYQGWYSKTIESSREIATLSTIRNELLSKLLSGKLEA